jgi:hypothetical protein
MTKLATPLAVGSESQRLDIGASFFLGYVRLLADFRIERYTLMNANIRYNGTRTARDSKSGLTFCTKHLTFSYTRMVKITSAQFAINK